MTEDSSQSYMEKLGRDRCFVYDLHMGRDFHAGRTRGVEELHTAGKLGRTCHMAWTQSCVHRSLAWGTSFLAHELPDTGALAAHKASPVEDGLEGRMPCFPYSREMERFHIELRRSSNGF